MVAVTEGAQAPDVPAPEGAAVQAPNLPRESAELGQEIERVIGEMERSIQLAGLKNDPLMPLLRTLVTSLGLQWRLHDQSVNYYRSVSDRLDLQLADTIMQGEMALEVRRIEIVEALAPELANLTARSVRSWNRTVTLKTGVALGAFAIALALGVGLAGYGAGWQAGHNTAVNDAGALAGAVQQAGPAAESALVDMVRTNNVARAWTDCRKTATPDKTGRRVCVMPMWAEPESQPVKG